MDKLNNSEKVYSMPIAEERSGFNWKKKLAKLVNTVDQSESRFLELGDLEYVPADFMELLTEREAARIRLRGTKIFVRGNESTVHQEAVRQLSTDITRSSFGRSKRLSATEEKSFIVVNLFECGALTKKIPDALLHKFVNPDPYVALEVAFSNETIDELYFESVHALTEYTTMEYAFGIKIHSSADNDHFGATLFAMRRAQGNPAASSKDLPLEAKEKYKRGEKKTVPHYDCALGMEKGEEFPKEYVELQMYIYGVEVFFTHQINEDNFYNDIVVPIEPSENVTFSALTISITRESYQYWWQQRYGPSAPRNQ
jgi:hypothetical protein